ncbi:MAG: Flp pilus assembly protein CpaB [Omnitrophica WOR_2 bacterium RIFCSPHIGHO2_02_FULL_52_10]|nr:MAG: Flp pilus assembly protein CpaB [Omnitrophica WOR_2 bacterium RIFCSPHIGHO2_02_FULL_52_10]
MNIENKKQLATILLAIGLGLVASMLMSKVVSDKVDEQTKIIAKEYQGRSSALVKEVDSTKQMLNKLAQDYQALAKKVEQQPVIREVPLKTDKPPVQKTVFSLRTPPGKRAITVNIKSLSAVGGLINPGDFVDVIAQLNVPEESDEKKAKIDKVTTVLFQNIQVLAVGTNYNPVGQEPAYEAQQQMSALNVTLAVSPEEAGLLSFAEANGDLQLSLRSPIDTEDKILQKVASWDALADFVLEQQGTELLVPKKKATIKKSETDKEEKEEEVKPFIQIFRGGREL